MTRRAPVPDRRGGARCRCSSGCAQNGISPQSQDVHKLYVVIMALAAARLHRGRGAPDLVHRPVPQARRRARAADGRGIAFARRVLRDPRRDRGHPVPVRRVDAHAGPAAGDAAGADPRRGVPVGMDVPLRDGRHLRERQDARAPRRHGPARRRARADHADVARRDPLVLRPRPAVQARRDPGPHQHVHVHADRARDVPVPMRRVLRPLALEDDVRGEGRVGRRLPGVDRAAAEGGAGHHLRRRTAPTCRSSRTTSPGTSSASRSPRTRRSPCTSRTRTRGSSTTSRSTTASSRSRPSSIARSSPALPTRNAQRRRAAARALLLPMRRPRPRDVGCVHRAR